MKKTAALLALLLPLLAGPAQAAATAAQAPAYISGGVDEDEKASFEAQRGKYNLQVLNSDKSGAYAVDDSFVIRDSQGRDVLNIPQAGPFIFVNLPAGTYEVAAVFGVEHKSQKVKIAPGKPARISFVWQTEG